MKSSVNQPVTLGAVDRLGRTAVGELGPVGDVGRRGDVVLVAGDEHAVLGRHEVGLDVVGAHARGQRVAGERVLGAVAGGAAVSDHDHRGGTIGGRRSWRLALRCANWYNQL